MCGWKTDSGNFISFTVATSESPADSHGKHEGAASLSSNPDRASGTQPTAGAQKDL